MSEPFIGEIRLFAFNFPPQGWAYCSGQEIRVQQNPALNAIIGTTYGGTQGQTFKLPNLQGCAVMGSGTGPGLTPRKIAAIAGASTVTLNSANMPSHDHAVNGVGAVAAALVQTPAPTLYLSRNLTTTATFSYVTPTSATVPTPAAMADQMVGPALGNGTAGVAAHENRQPFLTLNFCIALDGIFPMRAE